MSVQVKLHPAELFMNWYPRCTKLFLRGAKGASIEKLKELDEDLHDELVKFFDSLGHQFTEYFDSINSSPQFKDLLSRKKRKELEEWEKKQTDIIDEFIDAGKHMGLGNIPSFTYTCFSTGVGTVYKARNNYTGEELDISDYDSW